MNQSLGQLSLRLKLSRKLRLFHILLRFTVDLLGSGVESDDILDGEPMLNNIARLCLLSKLLIVSEKKFALICI